MEQSVTAAPAGSRLQVVGMGEMAISDDPQVTLITYSLGSCLGLALHDPQARVGGLLHSMMPMSRMSPDKARARPAMFTDLGVINLVNDLLAKGAVKRRLVVTVAGCGAPLQTNGSFKIGERNYAVLRKVLWKNDLLINGEDAGGSKPRTLALHIGTGRVAVKSGAEIIEL